MNRFRTTTLATALALGVTTFGCAPSPDGIELTTRSSAEIASGKPVPAETRLYVGDLLALEARPVNEAREPMQLCLEFESSDPRVVEIRRGKGPCDEPRTFVLGAVGAGTSRVRFGSRGTWSEISVVVLDTP